MKIFWSWQSDTPGIVGRYLVRDALKEAIKTLKQDQELLESPRDIHLDYDIKNVSGSPDLVRTILDKIEKSEIVVADVTIVGRTAADKGLINSNVAIELGYAWRACTDAKVLLVFNQHYGLYETLPFDLRHKGGAVVFELAPNAGRDDIDAQHSALTKDFVRKLRPFLQLQPRMKELLSLKPIIRHKRAGIFPLNGGGTDERFELSVSVENDGESAVTDFKLEIEIPTKFLDEGGHRLRSQNANPGFTRFEITHRDEIVRAEYFYPDTTTSSLISFHYAVTDQIKRQSPEKMQKQVTATVFSGNMKPKKISKTLAELMKDE